MSKYNATQLKPFINGWDILNDISREEQQLIIKEIDSIDIHRIIEDLPIDELSKKILISIENQELTHRTRGEMQKFFNQIQNVYNLYKNGGYSLGGYNAYEGMLHQFGVLHNFLQENFLIESVYGDFENLVLQLFEGTILSNLINGDYEYKLKEVNIYVYESAILNIQPKKLFELLKKYNHPFFKLKSTGYEKLIESALTFFRSGWEKDFLGNYKRSKIIEAQQKKSMWFSQRIRYIADNFFILLAHTNDYESFSEKLMSELTESILNHINANTSGEDQKYRAFFLRRKIKWFKESQLHFLIETILSDKLWSHELIENVCIGIQEAFPNFKIESNTLLEKIISRTSRRRSFEIKTEDILPFYPILNDSLKESFRKHILDLLAKENHPTELFFSAVDIGMIKYNEGNYFEKFLDRGLDSFTKYNLKPLGKGYYLENFEAARFIQMFYKNGVSLNKKLKEFLAKDDTPDFWKWVLEPKKFDYSKFDVRWLQAIATQSILKRLQAMKITDLQNSIKRYLQENYSEELVAIYFKLL